MSAPPFVYQGEDKSIVVLTNIDLTGATEIEFIINTPTQIKKTLSDGEISSVSSTQFSVQIDAADTETVKSGSYLYQCRATLASGLISQGKFSPNKLDIKGSAFVSLGSTQDYQ